MATASASPKALGRYELLCELSQSYLGSLWAVRVGSGEGQGLDATARCIVPGQAADQIVFDRLCEAAWTAMEIVSDRVPAVVDVVLQGNEIGVVADYCEGLWLRALSRQATLKHVACPVSVALRIGIDVLDGLAGVHAYAETLGELGSSLFGGVTPDSVLVGTDGRAHLTDMLVAGVAATLEEFSNHPERTPYLAPEQVRQTPVSARTDLFSVGVMLWEALAGRRLFFGIGGSVRQKILGQKIQPLEEIERPVPISQALSNVITRAVERDPSRRFDSARAMIDALTATGAPVAEPREVADYLEQVGDHELNRLRRGLERAVRSPRLSSKFRSVRPKSNHAPAPVEILPAELPAEPVRIAVQEIEVRPAPAVAEPPPRLPEPAQPKPPVVPAPEPRPPSPVPAKTPARVGSQPDLGRAKPPPRLGSQPEIQREAAAQPKPSPPAEPKPRRPKVGILPDLSRALEHLAELESVEEPLPPSSRPPPAEMAAPPPAPLPPAPSPPAASPLVAQPPVPVPQELPALLSATSDWPTESAEDEPTTLWFPRAEEPREPAPRPAVVVSARNEPPVPARPEPAPVEPRQRQKTILGVGPAKPAGEPESLKATIPGAPAPVAAGSAVAPLGAEPRRAPAVPGARPHEPTVRRSTLLGVAPMRTGQEPPPPPRRPGAAPVERPPEPAVASPPPPAASPPPPAAAAAQPSPAGKADSEPAAGDRGSIAALLEDELRAKPPVPAAAAIEHASLPAAAPPLIHDPRLAEMATGEHARPKRPRRRAKIGLTIALGGIAVVALALLVARELTRPVEQPGPRPSAPAVSAAEVAPTPSAVPSATASAAEAPASAPVPSLTAPAPEPPAAPRVAAPGPAPGPAAKPRPKRKKNYVPDDI